MTRWSVIFAVVSVASFYKADLFNSVHKLPTGIGLVQG